MEESLTMLIRTLLSIFAPLNSGTVHQLCGEIGIVVDITHSYSNDFYLCIRNQLPLGRTRRCGHIKAV